MCFPLCSVLLFVRVSVPCRLAPAPVGSGRTRLAAVGGSRGSLRCGAQPALIVCWGTKLAHAPSDGHFSVNLPLPEPPAGWERLSRSCHPAGDGQLDGDFLINVFFHW